MQGSVPPLMGDEGNVESPGSAHTSISLVSVSVSLLSLTCRWLVDAFTCLMFLLSS